MESRKINADETVKMSKCAGEDCERGVDLCCRDCEHRFTCDEVCNGPDDNGVDGHCEWRM